MDITNNVGIKVPQAPRAPRGADLPGVKQAQPQPQQSGADFPLPKTERSVDDKRYDQVVKAAQNYFKDVYAVSDSRFTIYKDTSGQYITRFTSLRDGRVTYIPEPQLLQYLERSTQSRESIIELNA